MSERNAVSENRITSLLQDAFESFNTKHEFHVGQVVQWKPGMKHKRSFGPFVVTEILEAPIMCDNQGVDAGSPYFRERLDIKVGTLDHEGDFVEYHHDSRRLEPFLESGQTNHGH